MQSVQDEKESSLLFRGPTVTEGTWNSLTETEEGPLVSPSSLYSLDDKASARPSREALLVVPSGAFKWKRPQRHRVTALTFILLFTSAAILSLLLKAKGLVPYEQRFEKPEPLQPRIALTDKAREQDTPETPKETESGPEETEGEATDILTRAEQQEKETEGGPPEEEQLRPPETEVPEEPARWQTLGEAAASLSQWVLEIASARWLKERGEETGPKETPDLRLFRDKDAEDILASYVREQQQEQELLLTVDQRKKIETAISILSSQSEEETAERHHKISVSGLHVFGDTAGLLSDVSTTEFTWRRVVSVSATDVVFEVIPVDKALKEAADCPLSMTLHLQLHEKETEEEEETYFADSDEDDSYSSTFTDQDFYILIDEEGKLVLRQAERTPPTRSASPQEMETHEETPTDKETHEETPIDKETHEETPTDKETHEPTPTDREAAEQTLGAEETLEETPKDEEAFPYSSVSTADAATQTDIKGLAGSRNFWEFGPIRQQETIPWFVVRRQETEEGTGSAIDPDLFSLLQASSDSDMDVDLKDILKRSISEKIGILAAFQRGHEGGKETLQRTGLLAPLYAARLGGDSTGDIGGTEEAFFHRHVLFSPLKETDLGKILRLQYQKGEQVPRNAILYALKRTLLSLGTLHSQGILHNNVSLESIAVTSKGISFLSDFEFKAAVGAETLCINPLLLAPEQVQEWEKGDTITRTEETDTWQMGCAAFQALTGRLPYNEEQIDILHRNLLFNGHPLINQGVISPFNVPNKETAGSLYPFAPDPQLLLETIHEPSSLLLQQGVPSQWVRLIGLMLQHDPRDRPTIQHLPKAFPDIFRPGGTP